MADKCDSRIIHIERVNRAIKEAISYEDAEELSQFFKAFSDPNRIRILTALTTQEMCVCDLAAFLQSSASAVSHQLRLLRTMNLVKNRRDGTVLYYRLSDDHVKEIIHTGLTHIKE